MTWDGSIDTTWSQPDATSWGGSTYNSGDVAQFFTPGAGVVTVLGALTPTSLWVQASSDYTFSGGSITTTGDLTTLGDGALILNNVTATIGGDLQVAAGPMILSGSSAAVVSNTAYISNDAIAGGGDASLTVADQAVLTMNDAVYLGNRHNRAGSVFQTGGTVHLNSTLSNNLRFGLWGGTRGLYRISGGTLNVPSSIIILGWNGGGTFDLNGGTANVNGFKVAYTHTNTDVDYVNLNAGVLNIGADGITKNDDEYYFINLNGGTLGALTAWRAETDVTLGGAVDVDTSGGNITFAGDVLGAGTMTKVGSGSLLLEGALRATAVVRSGTLSVSADGTLTNATRVVLEDGVFFDVSGATSPAEFGSGSTFELAAASSSPSLATAAGKGLTLADDSVLHCSAFVPASGGGTVPLALTGDGGLSFGSGTPVTITVDNGGVPLDPNESPFKLIAKSSGAGVTSLPGGAVVVDGDGAISTPSLVLMNDELFLELSGAGLPTLSVTVPDASADEQGTNPGTLRISRGTETTGNLTVFYTLSGTAGSGDYVESHTGTVVIPDGSSSVNLVFTPVDDADVEGYESVRLELTPDAAYNIYGAVGLLTIRDNESSGGLPTTTDVVHVSGELMYGEDLLFTATLQHNSLAAVDATGSYVFHVDGVPVATVPLTDGVAQFSASGLLVGNRTIEAVYAGASPYSASSSSTNVTIAVRTGRDLVFSTSEMSLVLASNAVPRLLRDGVLISEVSTGWSVYNFTTDTRTLLTSAAQLGPSEVEFQSADGSFIVNVDITGYADYLKLALLHVSNTSGGPLDNDWPGHRVEFDLQISTQPDGWELNTVQLNAMSTVADPTVGERSLSFEWPWPHLAQTNCWSAYNLATYSPEPQGAVAVYGFTSEEDWDDALARIWVNEPMLQRPDRDNTAVWDLAAVDAWLNNWIAEESYEKFRFDFSPDVSGSTAENYQRLKDAVVVASKAGCNQFRLHNFNWMGDEFAIPNPDLFANGLTTAAEFREFCKNQDIDLHFHGFGSTLQADDDDFIRSGNFSDGVARSARGWTATSATSSDTVLLVNPDVSFYLGMKPGLLPHVQPPPWGGGPAQCFPPYYDTNRGAVLINGQIYDYTASVVNGTQWRIELSKTLGQALTVSNEVEFVVQGTAAWYVPDPRSLAGANPSLLEVLADRYADALNAFQANIIYDGAGWHSHLGNWGVRKFSTMVYERMEHPSRGGQTWGHFDMLFRKIRNAEKPIASTIAMCIANTARYASSPDHMNYDFGEGADGLGFTLRGDHRGLYAEDVELLDFATFGRLQRIWLGIKPFLSPMQLAQMVDPFHNPPAREHFYAADHDVNQWKLTETQAMRRPEDSTWLNIPETPEIAPRQYLKADGVALTGLENPYAAQTPVIELHVMAAMSANATNNFSLMPTSAGMLVHPDPLEQRTGYDSGNLTVAHTNDSASTYFYFNAGSTPAVSYWESSSLFGSTLDMSESRGIAITVNVPPGQNVDGGVLAFCGDNRFPRTYIVELDFTGSKTFEIPNGEVVNNTKLWQDLTRSYSSVISRADYQWEIFRTFIAGLPAGTQTSVEITEVKAMVEDRTVGLVDPVLTLNGDSVTVSGTIPYNHYLKYSGGTTATVYNENWNFYTNLTVSGDVLTAANGANTFSVYAAGATNTFLGSRIKVQDAANAIIVNKPPSYDFDQDGLSDLSEVNLHGTDFEVWDTDGDGFSDGYEIQHGTDPHLDADLPELTMDADVRLAGDMIDVTFAGAVGNSYRLAASSDLQNWTELETGIPGLGETIKRSYPVISENSQVFYQVIRESDGARSKMLGIVPVSLHEGFNYVAPPLKKNADTVKAHFGNRLPPASLEAGATIIEEWDNDGQVLGRRFWHSNIYGAEGWNTNGFDNADGAGIQRKMGYRMTLRQGQGARTWYFTGEVPTNAVVQTVHSNGYTLVQSGFPVPVALADSQLRESGFTGGTSLRRSDWVLMYSPANQAFDQMAWLDSATDTWRNSDFTPTTRQLKPGEAFLIWRKSRNTGLTWIIPAPTITLP